MLSRRKAMLPFQWVLLLPSRRQSTSAKVPSVLFRSLLIGAATTMLHLNKDLKAAIEALENENQSIMMKSSCELFKRYVTRTWTDLQVFSPKSLSLLFSLFLTVELRPAEEKVVREREAVQGECCQLFRKYRQNLAPIYSRW